MSLPRDRLPNGYVHDQADSRDHTQHGETQGYVEREQRDLRSALDVENIVERFERWVLQRNHEMMNVVWFQSVKYEILTGEKATSEGIQRLALWHAPKGTYRTKNGTLRLRREWWLDNY